MPHGSWKIQNGCWKIQKDDCHRGTSVTIGTGGSSDKIHKIHQKLSKACQDPPGASRTHPGSTRDAPGARRTTFYFISQESQAPTPRARTSPSPSPGALIELQSPSDGITHAGTIEISRLSHPPTSDLKHLELLQHKAVWGMTPGAIPC